MTDVIPPRSPKVARQLDAIYKELQRTDLTDERRIELTRRHRRLTAPQNPEPIPSQIAARLRPAK